MFLNLCALILILATTHGFPSENNDKRCLNYCSDGGICVIEDGAARCDCLPGWEGKRCDQVRVFSRNAAEEAVPINAISSRNTKCSLVPTLCANGGICTHDGTAYKCTCPFPYDGKRCLDTSPCKDHCYNGGFCTYTGTLDNPTLTCDCKETGFDGDMCEKRTTTTTAVPTTTTTAPSDPACDNFKDFCNGATCRMDGDVPKCNCPPNTQGEFCEPIQQATQPPVLPGTTRPTNGPVQTNAPVVTNAPGVTNVPGVTNRPGGSSPGPQLTKTCRDNPCKNGGSCFNTGNNYFCYCDSRYTGYDCEIMKS